MLQKQILFCLLTGILILSGGNRLFAQSSLDLRINELLVYNDSNYVDDYGKHSPWIEIFNSAYNTVNIGGMYLTDDLSDPTKYLILKGQNITRIPQRSYLVFWADSNTTRGILHLNFSLEPGETIALFEANGRTLVDSVTIPQNLDHNVSYGRISDGSNKWDILAKTTPKSNNFTDLVETSGDQFLKFDPSGSAMSIIAMSVVFFGLAALYFFFKAMSRILSRDVKKQLHARSVLKAKAGVINGGDHHDQASLQITGEINAAIAMTLHLYASELHDAENTVLTINKVSRTYSPWSSKIYGLRKSPK